MKVISGGSSIPQRGGANPRVSTYYYLAKICQKLDENKENWKGGAHPKFYPRKRSLGQANVSVILFTGEGLTGRGGGLHPGGGGSAYRWRVCLQEEAVYNLRIPFNLTVRTSNLKSNLPGWKSTCQAWI